MCTNYLEVNFPFIIFYFIILFYSDCIDPNDESRASRFKNPLCEKQNKRNLECYYEPWSKCTFDDVYKNLHTTGQISTRGNPINGVPTRELATPHGKVHIIKYEKATVEDESVKLREAYESDVIVSIDYPGLFIDDKNNKHAYIPPVFDRLLACSPVKPELYYFWWRAVSVTYLIRPNAATLQQLEEVADPIIKRSGGRCIATYVRHGDKGSEMQLVPFERYRKSAEAIWDAKFTDVPSNSEASMSKEFADKKIMWLASEDPDVFREGSDWGKKERILIRYHRYKDEFFESGWKEPHQWTYFSYLMNLAESMRCEVMICTYQSNTCRIWDELRATVGAKANRYTSDVNYPLCNGDTPCIGTDISLFRTSEQISTLIW